MLTRLFFEAYRTAIAQACLYCCSLAPQSTFPALPERKGPGGRYAHKELFLFWPFPTKSNNDSTAKTGCLTPMGVFNSKNCLEQIAQKVLFQLKIANLDLHYYGFVFTEFLHI
jgi:hypothetical protein